VAGPIDNKGCPDRDRDKDGVVDRKDKCPDEVGVPERDGCPVPDKDKDGVLDDADKCPTEPEDMDKFEDEDGCPDPDNDKDGVADVNDKCPLEPETKNGFQDEDGCPDEVPVAVKKFTGVVRGITFRRNSADIKASSFPFLKEAVKTFKEFPQLRIEVSGHTSNDGKRDFNVKLSKKRAESVKGFLVSAGIEESRILTVGYGPDKPIEDNSTKEGQEKNRRIEFRLLSPNETTPASVPESAPEPEKPAKGAKAKGTKAKGDAAMAPGTAEKPAKAEKPAAEKPAKAEKPAAKKKAAAPPPDDDPTPSPAPKKKK
jgi:OOP family OmpA-OmpF porin